MFLRRTLTAAPFQAHSEDACGIAAAERISAVIDAHGPQEVAAVLMEPNAGTNGIVAPETFWPALRRATRAQDVYLIRG